jgi:hypothetical protein
LAVAASVGVSSRTGVQLPSPGGLLSVKWGRQSAQMASIRETVGVMGGQQGDRLLLRLPTAGDSRFELVRWEKSLECAQALVGVDPDATSWKERIARACWQPDPTLVMETLWDRGEASVLAAMNFPLEDPRGYVVDLERIDDLVERRLSRPSLCQHAGLGKHVLMADAGPGRARLTSIETTLLTRGLSSLTGEDGQRIEKQILVAPRKPEMPQLLQR